MAVLVFRIVVRVARINRYIGLIRIGARAGRGRVVDDVAAQDIRFRDLRLGRERLVRARSQARDRLAQAGTFVSHRDVFDRQVAVVLHRDLVAHGVAQLVAALRRRARGFLDYRQVAVLCFCVDSCLGRLLNIAELCRYSVLKAALQNIGLSDRIGRRRRNGLAARNVLKRALGKRDARDLAQRDRLSLDIDVRRRDREGYGLTKSILLAVNRLRDNQVVIDRLGIVRRIRTVGNSQRALDICDFVVCRDVSLTILHDRCSRDIVAAADQSLSTGDRNALDSIRSLQANRCSILPAIVRQRRTVIDLSVAVCRDR